MSDMSRLTVHRDGQPCYDIIYAADFSGLPGALSALGSGSRRICIVTDTVVGPLYAGEVLRAVREVSPQVQVYTIPAGEENKTLDEIRGLYRFLVTERYDRSSLLIALGGGVIGDMTGYAAATFLRGIDFVQIPTTLLAQADSSIGGKTGVDFDGFKNMVGAFKMPALVYENVSVLKTLDARQFASGFAEVMKHGLIKDQAYYEWLLAHMKEIRSRVPGVLQAMLRRSNEIKKDVVENDPYEKGERMLLNYGHTLGHAIEKEQNFTLTHGECVALGCVAAAHIAKARGWLDSDEYYEIRDMFVPFGLPITVSGVDAERVITLTKSDKKAKGGIPRFVLLKAVGEAVVAEDVTEEEMRAALGEIIWKEDME